MAAAHHTWHHSQADLQYTLPTEPEQSLVGSQGVEKNLQRRKMEEAEKD
jgi:hypothetical protein